MADKEGWLTKEGGKIKTWKKRWCILQNGKLAYYAKKGGDLKGEIPIAEFGSIRAASYKDKKNVFNITCSDRTYHFVAETPEEMASWIKALTAARKKELGISDKAVSVDDFKSLKVIGKGSFGKVVLVEYIPTGDVFAMKILNKKTIIERKEVKNCISEKSILTKLNNPFLVRLYYAFQTPTKLYFVLDYVNGGELFFHLQKSQTFTPERVLFYSAEILLGIEYLHSQGIIYRDLKPENLLLTADGHICMTDFGISKEGLMTKDARTATFCGTPEYLAPEVLEGKEYGKEVDWWSLGTLMYEMLVGLPPFFSEDVQEMYQKIMTKELKLEKKIPNNPNAVALIRALLEREPTRRLSSAEAIKAHPYFASVDWEKMARKEVRPPFIPPVKSERDISQIDPTFTRESAALSIGSMEELSASIQENFSGFTYVADEEGAK